MAHPVRTWWARWPCLPKELAARGTRTAPMGFSARAAPFMAPWGMRQIPWASGHSILGQLGHTLVLRGSTSVRLSSTRPASTPDCAAPGGCRGARVAVTSSVRLVSCATTASARRTVYLPVEKELPASRPPIADLSTIVACAPRQGDVNGQNDHDEKSFSAHNWN